MTRAAQGATNPAPGVIAISPLNFLNQTKKKKKTSKYLPATTPVHKDSPESFLVKIKSKNIQTIPPMAPDRSVLNPAKAARALGAPSDPVWKKRDKYRFRPFSLQTSVEKNPSKYQNSRSEHHIGQGRRRVCGNLFSTAPSRDKRTTKNKNPLKQNLGPTNRANARPENPAVM